MTNFSETPWEHDPETGEVWSVPEHGSVCMVLQNGRENGPLIASAPDLYAALADLLTLVVNRILMPDSEPHVKAKVLAAMTALERARTETPKEGENG